MAEVWLGVVGVAPLVGIGVVALLGYFRPVPVVLAAIVSEFLAIVGNRRWADWMSDQIMAGRRPAEEIPTVFPGPYNNQAIWALGYVAYAVLVAGLVLLVPRLTSAGARRAFGRTNEP